MIRIVDFFGKTWLLNPKYITFVREFVPNDDLKGVKTELFFGNVLCDEIYLDKTIDEVLEIINN